MSKDEPTQPKWRILLLVLLIVGALYHLITSLYEVQVGEGEMYVQRLREQTTVPVRLSPARGEILDRNGVALARNRSSFDIDIYLDELVRNYRRQHRGHVPRTDYRWNGRLRTNQVDIVQIVNECLDPIAQSLGFEHRPDPKDLIRHYITSKELPFQLKADVDFETLAKFSERNLSIPGIDIVARPVREYTFGALAPHVLGYVGAPKEKKQHLAEDGYPYDTIGRNGIEEFLDPQLQGKPGSKMLRVNYRGYIESKEDVKAPTVGNSIKLTLDARIQYLAEQALRDKKVGRGAAVVLDVHSGDILAMASVPSFDPNDFIPSIDPEKWSDLTRDPTKPLFNRAISGYPAGSTYKVLIALAALKSGTITPHTRINSPSVVYIAGHPFKDWYSGGRGPITVHTALQWSCNTFFYQAGVRTGIANIKEMGDTVGFGQKSGIPLKQEQSGIMPDPNWLRENHPRERWTSATTANASIGQGYTLTTPLQLAAMTAAVANGGTVYKPRLLKSVTDVSGGTFAEFPSKQVRGELGMEFDDLVAVREAMRAVVTGGTGGRSNIPDYHVAGKTGTAQAWSWINGRNMKDNKAWFISFAPYESPRYAMCVMVEGGSGGGTDAAPVARQIYEGIQKMEKGDDPKLTYLTPTKGHFRGTTSASSSSSSSSSSASSQSTSSPRPESRPQRRRNWFQRLFD